MLLAAALMIGLSLVGATAVLAASLTTSINAETDATFGADYVLTGTGRSPISTEIIDKARAIPGVDAILIAIHGALLGLGLAWGVAGQQVLVGYGITALTIPWTTLAAIVVGAIVIGLIAALLPSLRAARLTPLTALSIE